MTKKERILKEAARLFAEKGFNETPTSDIADAAETAHGTVFYHFPTKQDILKEIYETLVKEYLEALDDVTTRDLSGLDTVRALLRVTLEFMEEHRNENTVLHRDLPGQIFKENEWGCQVLNKNKVIINIYQTALKRGICDGSVRPDIDVQEVAKIFRALIIGTIRLKSVHSIGFESPFSVMDDFCLHAIKSGVQNV